MALADLMTWVSEHIGDIQTALLIGLTTGIIFGFAAQRSAFCLRSAAVELGRGRPDSRMAVWLIAVGAAVLSVQLLSMAGLFEVEAAQLMNFAGSWSGAVIGGLIFGVGMVLARGCSGRLLVLAGTGNLRCVMAGMVFALVSQFTIGGVLSPVRQWVYGLSTTANGRNVDLLDSVGAQPVIGVVIGALMLAMAVWLAARTGVTLVTTIFAVVTGLAVAVGWALTYAHSLVSFEPVGVVSATFAAPSAGVVLSFMTGEFTLGFGLGLVPGVFIGAFLAGLICGELKLQGYQSVPQMLRSLSGGALMGFGGVLAGGCAIGAGVTGVSIFVGPLVVATVFFFIGAAIADRIVDGEAAANHMAVQVQR